MSWVEFLQSSAFAAILTFLISIATCVISEAQGYRKMKLQYFNDIYSCLEQFTKNRTEVIDKCNEMSKELAEKFPNADDTKSEKSFLKRYDNLYCGMNKMISEYSKCLELYLSMSYFLNKDKSLKPIVKAECWNFLNVYGKLIVEGEKLQYKIHYAQIVNLVQFIKIAGTWRDRKALRKYLKKYHIFEF